MASQVRRLKKRTGIAAVVALCAAVSFTIPTALPRGLGCPLADRYLGCRGRHVRGPTGSDGHSSRQR